MIVKCSQCNLRFDDQFRWTVCPHGTFLVNDGANQFSHHPESYKESGPTDQQAEDVLVQKTKEGRV